MLASLLGSSPCPQRARGCRSSRFPPPEATTAYMLYPAYAYIQNKVFNLAFNIVELWWKADWNNVWEGVSLVPPLADPENVLATWVTDSSKRSMKDFPKSLSTIR